MNNSEIYQVSKMDLRPSERKRITEPEEGGRVPGAAATGCVSEQPAVGAGNRAQASPRAVKRSYLLGHLFTSRESIFKFTNCPDSLGHLSCQSQYFKR
jgi:hypothetical protein